MALVKIKKVFYLLTLFVFFLPEPSNAERSFTFKDEGSLSGWRILGPASVRVSGSGVEVRSNAQFTLVSPEGLEVPREENAIEVRGTFDGNYFCVLYLNSVATGKVYAKRFTISGVKGSPSSFRVYFGDLMQAGDSVNGFALGFMGRTPVDVRLESLGFFKPSHAARLSIYWEEFWRPEVVLVSSINFITTPAFGPFTLMHFSYALIVAVFAAAYFLLPGQKGQVVRMRALKAGLVAFAVAGALFAGRMDYNWLRLWQDDIAYMGGVDVEERTVRLFTLNNERFGDFYGFLKFMRARVPEGEKVSPAVKNAGDFYGDAARYFLLPVKTSRDARFVWVYNDPGVYYDDTMAALVKDGVVAASPVRPYAVWRQDAAVYELAPGARAGNGVER